MYHFHIYFSEQECFFIHISFSIKPFLFCPFLPPLLLLSCLLLPSVLGFSPTLLVDSAPSVLAQPPDLHLPLSPRCPSSSSCWAPMWSVLLLNSALTPCRGSVFLWLSLSLLGCRNHSFTLQKIQWLGWEEMLHAGTLILYCFLFSGNEKY